MKVKNYNELNEILNKLRKCNNNSFSNQEEDFKKNFIRLAELIDELKIEHLEELRKYDNLESFTIHKYEHIRDLYLNPKTKIISFVNEYFPLEKYNVYTRLQLDLYSLKKEEEIILMTQNYIDNNPILLNFINDVFKREN